MYASLDQAGNQWKLTYTRELRQSPDEVWCALVEPRSLAVWFPTAIEGEREEGAKIRFVFPMGDAFGAEEAAMLGEILHFDPPALLEYTWASENLRYLLEPTGTGGTTLTFSFTFDDVGTAARDATGWHVCLDLLAEHLSGALDAAPERKKMIEEQWRPLFAHYAENLGPDSSTQGGPPGADLS
ncbi:SRPBCC family protein [Nocardiopsis rhodophaea]|uniref:SRPBCC family protein n=1 Tax=Nocardiopsis rhodophaea TaxID=280238 RepID=A0ABN2SQT9_9ACTN